MKPILREEYLALARALHRITSEGQEDSIRNVENAMADRIQDWLTRRR